MGYSKYSAELFQCHGWIKGWSDGAEATPSSLKFCTIFIQFLEKYKVSIELASGQVSRPPLSEFSAPDCDGAGWLMLA